MSERSAGRAVVELLKAEQVRYIFGIVGSTFLDVLDALYDDRSVEYINVRHEQAAAFMADGLARVTDVPGVCLVTSGPGATNLLTGVAAAHVAHSPVVVLVGGVDLDHHGKDAFQDYDLVSMFRPVTKLAVQVPTPGRIPEMLRAALRAAMTGRRGPVFVEIPRNVLNDQTLAGEALPPAGYRVTHPLPPHPDAIAEAARLLRQAERPLLLVGGGVTRADASALVVSMAEQHAIPMITAYGRNDAGDAIIGKAHDRIRHQPHRLQKIVSHHRIEDVELEMTLAAGHRDGHVIAEDLRANHCQGFALSGIYLARHDR